MRIKIGVLVAIVMGILPITTDAIASVRLVATMPSQNGFAQPRTRLWLRFSEPVDLRTARITIRRGGSGDVPVRLMFSRDRRVIYLHPSQPLRRGTYQVVWRVTGNDGQAVHSGYDFVVV